MAINVTDLFTKLGKVAGTLLAVNTSRGTTIPSAVDSIADEYTVPDTNLIGNLFPSLTSYQSAANSLPSYLQGLFQSTIIQIVNADVLLNQPTLEQALIELIAQMTAATDYFTPNVLSFGSPSYGGSNRGNGVLLGTMVNAFGVTEAWALAEALAMACTGDSSTGATDYNEPFTILSPASVDQLSWLWPDTGGSGVNVSINSVDPSSDNSNGNNLTNSDFENWTTGVPDNWLAPVPSGVAAGGSVDAYFGSNCLQFTQTGGSPLSSVTQTFNTGAGTPYSLLPDTAYGFVIWAKKETGLSGNGTVAISLINASTNAVLTDDLGNALTLTYTCASLSTSYAAKSTVFRTPRALPAAGVKLRISLTIAIADSGLSVWHDYASMTPLTQLYTGGPLLALFSGSEPWAQGDTIDVSVANNYAGDWLMMLQRMCNMRQLGLYVPTTGSNLVNDSLISV
jgi:hypothetical protein